MSGSTTNYGWILPIPGGDKNLWGDYLNTNLEDQDDLIRAIENTNIGISAPPNNAAGTQWINNTNSALWSWTINDGSEQVVIGSIDTANHTFIPTGGLTRTIVSKTSTGTYTVPAGFSYADVIVVGAGGGGTSGGYLQDGSGVLIMGAGGGAGSYAIKRFTASDLGGVGASITVTIGAGGAGGATATDENTVNSGSNGGNTTFGAFLTAHGGSGATVGTYALVSKMPLPGAGGTATTGDFVASGGNGGVGLAAKFYHAVSALYAITASGNGGASYYGGAGLGVLGVYNSTTAGNNGVANTGGGGSGGCYYDPESGAQNGGAGGNGGSGICYIIQYLA